jgi:UDP-N-acetylglucosamine 4-epimerase
MTRMEALEAELRATPQTWLVTGCAGFIGSHLTERLLSLGQTVAGLDNFATGHRSNLDDVQARVGDEAWARFRLHEGSIEDPAICGAACEGVDRVLHQAALGSVPRSLEQPLATHRANVDGFLNMLIAARDAKVKRFVYASSSSVYGDEPNLPKVEDKTGNVLSPYAATKAMNEIYAEVFERSYDIEVAGLRYFNVFGPRQDPQGAYAAVIPRWVAALLRGEACQIYGDGETSRDFCYVDNAVQANLLAATSTAEGATGRAYNVAFGHRTSLNELYRAIRDALARTRPALAELEPAYGDFRPGDVRHSLANTDAAAALLGYEPAYDLARGLDEALDWYVAQLG